MRLDVITLFPELFGPFLTTGVTRRAFEGPAACMQLRLWPLREHADDAYRRVDDRPAVILVVERVGPACERLLFAGRGCD